MNAQPLHTYRNPWHRPHDPPATMWQRDKETVFNPTHYKARVDPIEYKGFLIFERIKHRLPDACVCDVVQNGEALTQRVTVRSCKAWIDERLAGNTISP